MCSMGLEQSPLLEVDAWEAIKPEYTPTLQVLDHIRHEINEVRDGDGSSTEARIALLAGADLLETFHMPGVWAEEDLFRILERYGAFVIERSGTDVANTISRLKQPTDKIHVITQEVKNDVSSTKIRDFVNRGLSVRYLVPENVIEYIDKHGLYKEPRRQDETGLRETSKD